MAGRWRAPHAWAWRGWRRHRALGLSRCAAGGGGCRQASRIAPRARTHSHSCATSASPSTECLSTRGLRPAHRGRASRSMRMNASSRFTSRFESHRSFSGTRMRTILLSTTSLPTLTATGCSYISGARDGSSRWHGSPSRVAISPTHACAGSPDRATHRRSRRSRARPSSGYELRFAVPRAALCPELSIDVLVNEMSPGRQRRRGQLVLSGARGDRVYLRGDRQPLDRFLRVRLPR